jgi:chromosomal replication initiation ATPase DnaA
MKPQSVNQAINAAAELWDCAPSDLTGQEITQRIVGPRQALSWWLHTRLGASMTGIARGIGARHHTTVWHACRAVEAALSADKPNKRQVWLARCADEIDAAFAAGRVARR